MSQNYQRYQIILSENTTEFTMKGKKALGKCVLEAKGESGKVSFSVQNLKPGVICNAYIVSSDNVSGAAIDIGRIIVSDKGSAELKWECSADDVDGSGIALNAFNVAGMMILDGNAIKAPIVGHRDREVAWKNNLHIHSKKLPETAYAEPIKDELPENDPEPNTLFLEKDEIPPPPEAVSPPEFFETLEEGAAEKTFKDMAKKINEKLSEIDNITEDNYKVEALSEADTPAESVGLSESEMVNLQNIFVNCSKIRPFKEQDSDLQWVRITPNELNYLPDEFKHLKDDYLIVAAYKKFNHLILGYKNQDNISQIIFGMPDIYTKISKDSAHVSGLIEFSCCDCKDIEEGKHGYWLKTVSYRIDKEGDF
ncbi:MAG: hypothetical protein FWE24_01390 [Defluviitaleaceae bacterium]|nr:hypothetical protein [Defluviitaleaceae bacterium]